MALAKEERIDLPPLEPLEEKDNPIIKLTRRERPHVLLPSEGSEDSPLVKKRKPRYDLSNPDIDHSSWKSCCARYSCARILWSIPTWTSTLPMETPYAWFTFITFLTLIPLMTNDFDTMLALIAADAVGSFGDWIWNNVVVTPADEAKAYANPKKDCDIIKLETELQGQYKKKELPLPAKTIAAYVRTPSNVFYVNKAHGIFEDLKLTSQELIEFDEVVKPEKARTLLKSDLADIKEITGHEHLPQTFVQKFKENPKYMSFKMASYLVVYFSFIVLSLTDGIAMANIAEGDPFAFLKNSTDSIPLSLINDSFINGTIPNITIGGNTSGICAESPHENLMKSPGKATGVGIGTLIYAALGTLYYHMMLSDAMEAALPKLWEVLSDPKENLIKPTFTVSFSRFCRTLKAAKMITFTGISRSSAAAYIYQKFDAAYLRIFLRWSIWKRVMHCHG